METPLSLSLCVCARVRDAFVLNTEQKRCFGASAAARHGDDGEHVCAIKYQSSSDEITQSHSF